MNYTAAQIKTADPKRCWVDNVANVSDKHHIVPVEYGGPETGLTVPLCPTCHRNIHREAAERLKLGPGTSKYVNEENYPEVEPHNRASFLVEYIVQSKIRFDATGEEKAEGARNMIQLSCTREQLAMAHDVKKSMGMKSLERMILLLITEKWISYKKGKK